MSFRKRISHQTTTLIVWYSTLHWWRIWKIHCLLRSGFNPAILWGNL